MNSYERVLKAVTFDGPDRIPLARGRDIASVGYAPARDFQPPQRQGITRVTEWGIAWKSLNASRGDQGQVAGHPLADWEKSNDYRFPDPFAPGRFEGAAETLAAHRRDKLFVIGQMGKGPMHLLDDLRGFENYLADLLLEPSRVDWLLEGIFRFLGGLLEQFADLGVDGVELTDDQAMQSGPIFSMDLWRRHLKPRYRELFARARARKLFVFMHACGNLAEHLGDLHDVGVNVIDNKQPALWMDSPAVDAVRGRLAFSTCLDIQSVMQGISPGDIEAEVRRLVRRLSTPAGGFIANWYDKPDLAFDPGQIRRMVRAFTDYRYRRRKTAPV